MPAVVGQPAPDFSLRDTQNTTVSLADLRGQKALIVFIPFPFTSTCDRESCAIRDDYSQLQGLGAKVVVITVHAAATNRKWAETNGFQFPILADFWPHGAVAQAYGAFNEMVGSANRYSYVLDASGVVREVINSESLGQAREHAAYARALAQI